MIRRAVAEDEGWIRSTAASVYAHFGDYGKIIPSWMSHPGVLTFVECADPDAAAAGVAAADPRRGFILLGFYEPADVARGHYVADLLAIAVAPDYQKSGVGRRLLDYAIDLATLAGQRVPVPEIRLTVADTNDRARRMFTNAGFQILDPEHGAYDGGQRAIRMRRVLGVSG